MFPLVVATAAAAMALPLGPLPDGPGPLPNVWGGRAFGTVGSASGHLFAYSGADGATSEESGFVGVLTPNLWEVRFVGGAGGGDAVLWAGLGGGGGGTLLAASSDTVVVAPPGPAANKTAAMPGGIVLAYRTWDLLVGRAPAIALVTVASSAESTGASPRGPASAPFCNATGRWHVGGHGHWAAVAEGPGGLLAAVAHGVPKGGWTSAAGKVDLASGEMDLAFNNGRGTDHAVLAQAPNPGASCTRIDWASGRPGWSRLAPAPAPPGPQPPPTPPTPPTPSPGGCTTAGRMALCRAASPSQLFAVAYGDNATAAAATAAAALANLTAGGGGDDAVDVVARANLAHLAALPPPGMRAANESADVGLGRLAAKMYSIMRVNTLSPEGSERANHWSTPDRTPHRAMWLWDSCFHAIGRAVADPGMAWQFVASMLDAQAADGHVPGGLSPWAGAPANGNTNPPLLALATWYRVRHGP